MSPAISFFVGPAVGAVIGYLTNYLAVKMLFRPYTEKRIGRLRLPFTPGVIPRRRKDLAHALGEAVGSRLVTREDLARLLVSDDSVKALTEVATQALLGEAQAPLSARIKALLGEESERSTKAGIDRAIADAVTEALAAANIGSVLLREGAGALCASNPMLGMFLGDSLLEKISPTVNERLNTYLSENGRQEILPAVEKQTTALLTTDVQTLLSRLGFDREALSGVIENAVRRLLNSFLPTLLDRVDLAGIVEDKINEMDVRELEALVLSVMKRELGAVVNLGAVIGFILGFVTAFF